MKEFDRDGPVPKELHERQANGMPISTSDRLREMFIRNSEFTSFVKPDSLERMKSDKELWLVFNAMALTAEVGEMVNEIPYKWWGRGNQEIDEETRQKIGMEGIDIMHFLFNIFEGLGFNFDDIYKMYVEKNNLNRRRVKEKIGWGEANH